MPLGRPSQSSSDIRLRAKLISHVEMSLNHRSRASGIPFANTAYHNAILSVWPHYDFDDTILFITKLSVHLGSIFKASWMSNNKARIDFPCFNLC